MRVVGEAWWRRMKLIMSVHNIGSRAMGTFDRGMLVLLNLVTVDVIEERCTVCVILPYYKLLTPENGVSFDYLIK